MNKNNLSGVFKRVVEWFGLLPEPLAVPESVFYPPSPRSLDDWLNNPSSKQDEEKGPSDEVPASYVDEIFGKLMMSATFRAMYQSYPALAGFIVSFIELEGERGGHYFDGKIDVNCGPATKACFIKNQDKFVDICAHEYRHGWQKEHLGYAKLEYDHSSLIRSFFLEADAVSFEATVCWELKQMGIDGPWQNFEMTFPVCAKALKCAVKKDKTSFADGRAQNAVLQAWFEAPENLQYYTNASIENLQTFIDKPVEDVARSFIKYREEWDAKRESSLSSSRALTLFQASPGRAGAAMSFLDDEEELVPRSAYLQEDNMFDRSIMFYTRRIPDPLIKRLETLQREADFHYDLANITIMRGEVQEEREWDIEIKITQPSAPQVP